MSKEKELADSLAQDGYAICKDYLSHSDIEVLVEDLLQAKASGLFQAAGIGQGSSRQLRTDIRRDEILWFEPLHLRTAQRALWDRLGYLQTEINKTCFLGLWDIEGHYALYSPGGFYRRHVDRFRADDARTVSVVMYLNTDWKPEHGGELSIFLSPSPETQPETQEKEIRIEPRAGTLVCFMSDSIEHEVRESSEVRMSFAGWFRRRN